MATRRKNLVTREPNGRAKRSPLPRMLAPSEVRRLRDAAMVGLRAAEWGSSLGWLYIHKRIDDRQYAAGRLWCEIMRDYGAAIQGPRQPKTANLDPTGGTSADPDSDTGHREARRHVIWINMGEAGSKRLKSTGEPVRRVVMAVCEQDQIPAGMAELIQLRKGLDVLAALWSGGRMR